MISAIKTASVTLGILIRRGQVREVLDPCWAVQDTPAARGEHITNNWTHIIFCVFISYIQCLNLDKFMIVAQLDISQHENKILELFPGITAKPLKYHLQNV